MNIALWIAQGLLAALFGMAGVMKTFSPIEKLAGKMPWVSHYSVGMVRFIGLSELLGAIGVVLPWALGIAHILTPISAVGLALTQILAAIHHGKYDNGKGIPLNIALGGLALFVAFGRF